MKTDIKVSTKDCSHCGESHSGYHLKRDSKGHDYIICGSGPLAQRVDVEFVKLKSKNPYQPGKWTIDDTTDSGDVQSLCDWE